MKSVYFCCTAQTAVFQEHIVKLFENAASILLAIAAQTLVIGVVLAL